MKFDDPIFIIGNARSGTTFLAESLGKHKDIYHFPKESKYFLFLLSLLGKNNSFDEQKRYNEFYGFVRGYMFPLLRISGKKIFLEKSPNNIFCASELKESFKGARFLHIVRDPRDVVFSKNQKIFQQMDINNAANDWQLSIKTLLGSLSINSSLKGSLIHIKYEDLIKNGKDEMTRILKFLDLEDESFVQRFRSSIDNSAVGQSKKFDEYIIKSIEEICQTGMQYFGYVN